MSKYDMKWHPSAEYRFFLREPEGDGMQYFRSETERDAAAAESVLSYLDGDGWSEEVMTVCVGTITGFAQQCNVQHKPKREDFESDDDFEDEMSAWPGEEFDTVCEYKIVPIAPNQKEGGQS